MKKVFMTLAMVMAMTTVTLAQKVNVSSYMSKIEKSDATIADAKKAAKANTWMSRGALFTEIAGANSSLLFGGMPEDMLLLNVGKPDNADAIEEVVLNGTRYKKFVYSGVDVYLTIPAGEDEMSTVACWLETKPVYEGAIDVAIEAYEKALSIDPSVASKVGEAFGDIVTMLATDGQFAYDAGEYKKAEELLAKAASVDEKNPVAPTTDPAQMYYYAAVAAVQADLYADAEKNLKIALDKGFEADGDTYYYLGYSQEKQEKKADAKETYIAGIEKYINNQNLLTSFISFCLLSGEDPSLVLSYISKAQAADPQNASNYLAEGVVYDQMKEYDKAIPAYEKALQIDPKMFPALFNLGFAYRAKAIAVNKEITQTDYTNTARIEELKTEFLKDMRSAIDPFEKAHELQPANKDVVEILKSLYFTLREEGPEMQANYEKYNTMFQSM